MRVRAGRCWLVLRRQAGRGASRQERDPRHLLYHVCCPMLASVCAKDSVTHALASSGGRSTRCTWRHSRAWRWRLARAARCMWRTRRAIRTTSFGTRGPGTPTTPISCVSAALPSEGPFGSHRCVFGAALLRAGTLLLTQPFSLCSRRSGWVRAPFLCVTSTRADTCSATTAASTTRPTTLPRLGARTKPQTTGRGRARPACVQCVLACTFGMTPAATEPLLRARTTASERLESSLTFQNTSWRT